MPNNIHKYTNLSTALTVVGKYTDAIVYADKALAINPAHMLAKFNKAFGFYMLGKLPDADTWYHNLR
ncbi:MAG: hypothetical protein WCL02_04955 [bacterium]